jgi:Fe-S cluster biosynthesis and repair protein YggX
MDEISKLAIDRIAHICTKAIIERLLELGILAQEHRQELLHRVDHFFATRHSEALKGYLNGKYSALNGTSKAY